MLLFTNDKKINRLSRIEADKDSLHEKKAEKTAHSGGSPVRRNLDVHRCATERCVGALCSNGDGCT